MFFAESLVEKCFLVCGVYIKNIYLFLENIFYLNES